MLTQMRLNSSVNFLVACLLAGLMAACGGGGSVNDGCVNVDPSRPGTLPGCGGTTSPGTGGSTTSGMTLALTNAGGTAINSISPDAPGTLQVTVKDSTGKAVPNVAVTFTTTDDTAVLSPSSGTALTDANGVAKIMVASGTKAGAFTAKAAGSVGATLLTASAGYAVTFPSLALSDVRFASPSISSGGNTSVSITVMSGTSPYMPSVAVSFASPCIDAKKATIGTPVQTQSGVAVAIYTDKGCGTSDTIKASIVTPSGTVSKLGTINIAPPEAGSLSFIGVDNSNIALVGTGGPGRVEFSNVKFRMYDKNGNPMIGAPIKFVFGNTGGTQATIGGLKMYPESTITDNEGYATTNVSNGTIPTSIRVVAFSAANETLTTISSVLVVSSAVPDQKHFTVYPEIGNCEGWDIVRVCTKLVAILADHFSNPVPDGTAVNFTTEAGMVEATCRTVGGKCTVDLTSSNPPPGNGWLTVLAYAFGDETLNDNNGNNVYDAGDTFADMSPDIFRDDNENSRWDPTEPCVGPNNGSCSTPPDGLYNGVLRRPQDPYRPQSQYIWTTYKQVFSGSNAVFEAPSALSCTAGGTVVANIKVRDVNSNLMPAGTSIGFAVTFNQTGGSVAPVIESVRNVTLAVGQLPTIPTYAVTVTCPLVAATGKLTVTATTPLGTTRSISIPIN